MVAQDNSGPRITVSQNGPYMVSGRVPLKNAQGEALGSRERYLLCRCGGSANKPFCDGTHNRIGFDGTEVADRGPISHRRKAYQGNEITVYDDRSICSHSGVCTDNLAAVFRLAAEPFVHVSGASAKAIIEVIKRCPSGALSYGLGTSAEAVEEGRSPTITATKDGPLAVAGRVELVSEDGTTHETRARYTLCRCGGSKNKPYCDGSHWQLDFKDGQ